MNGLVVIATNIFRQATRNQFKTDFNGGSFCQCRSQAIEQVAMAYSCCDFTKDVPPSPPIRVLQSNSVSNGKQG